MRNFTFKDEVGAISSNFSLKDGVRRLLVLVICIFCGSLISYAQSLVKGTVYSQAEG